LGGFTGMSTQRQRDFYEIAQVAGHWASIQQMSGFRTYLAIWRVS
jgi:hypothetical protein